MSINLNKTLMAVAMTLGMASMAHAAGIVDQGHGKVTFTGAIIDAPCSISPESIDQTVELGQISKAALAKGGKSTPRNFTINLENCSFGDGPKPVNNSVALAFTGMASSSGNGLLGITGTAKGASVAITSGNGKVIELGKKTDVQLLGEGSNTLSFAAYVQGDDKNKDLEDVVITEGDFQAVADFTLSYS